MTFELQNDELETAFVAELLNDSSISTKVNNSNGNDNIQPLKFDEGTDLSNGYGITYSLIDGNNSWPNVHDDMYQLSCFGDTYKNCKDLAKDVFRVLNYFKKDSLGNAPDDYFVDNVIIEGTESLYEEDLDMYYIPLEVKFIS